MAQHVVSAGARELSTKGNLHSLRRNGGIPAVIYNRHGKCTPIALNVKEFQKATEGVSESTIIRLDVGTDSFQCLVKDRQLDWLHGKILHVDFFEVESGVAMRAKVPVHLKGSAVGVRDGGILENPVHEIEVECMPQDMPEKFEVDISGLQANHSIHVRDIVKSDAVKILSSPDQVVVLVKFAKAEEVVAPTAEEVAAAEAAAAAAATPGTAAPGTAAPGAPAPAKPSK